MVANLKAAGIIARGTFVEAIRSRILTVTLFVALVLIVGSVMAASVSLGQRSRIIVDIGLAASSAIGTIIALALTVVTYGREIRDQTIHIVLTRPIARWAYLLGKYLGLVLAMELVVAVMVLATAATTWLHGGAIPDALWLTCWLNWVEMAVVVAIALFFSTLAVPGLAASYAAGVLIAGNLADDILLIAQAATRREDILNARIIEGFYYLLPDLAEFSVRTQAANNLAVPANFVTTATAYGMVYACVVLIASMWLFSNKKSI